jgi:hypothetical protein
MSGSRALWIGSGLMVAIAFTSKQYMWSEVSSMVKVGREEEDRVAVDALHKAYEKAKKYHLEPLKEEDRQKLQILRTSDISKFSNRDKE